MRRFILQRQTDVTGISGTGIILYGIEWKENGPCDVFWLKTETTGQYPSVERLRQIHCYPVEGVPNATLVFLDPIETPTS